MCAIKAVALAQEGYVGFALDAYGKGVLGTTVEENTRLMTPFMEDRDFLQQRLQAGYEALCALPQVDEQRVAAIGYCFGGLCVARSHAHRHAAARGGEFAWLVDPTRHRQRQPDQHQSTGCCTVAVTRWLALMMLLPSTPRCTLCKLTGNCMFTAKQCMPSLTLKPKE